MRLMGNVMREDTPLISILIPCHNAEQWVGQAISSALAQTWPNKEIIVVDDGSTDGSLEIIRSFGTTIHFESGPNRGANPARNRLLELARGQWLQYLDADDYLLETKVADQLTAIQGEADIDVIFSPMTVESWRGGQAGERTVLPVSSNNPWLLMARWQMPGTHAVIMRRSAVMEVGGWKPDQPCCQEHELFVRLMIAGKRFAYVSKPGAIYRHWSTSTVSKKDPCQTVFRRLEIADTAEAYLTKTKAISTPLSDAFASQRIECARTLYQFDRTAAIKTAAKAARIHPSFKLKDAPCFPAFYRILYNNFGFKAAETIAAMARPWRNQQSMGRLLANSFLLSGAIST
jgi:cellulose synthase/poly-beta-1,6-N-acetylglucosamine synthase-like glycosyltransferase